MATYDDRWFELWYSEGTEVIPTYLLIVTTNIEKIGEIIVVDPFKNNEIIFREMDYQKICDWLTEDEYELAEGRVFPDDGW